MERGFLARWNTPDQTPETSRRNVQSVPFNESETAPLRLPNYRSAVFVDGGGALSPCGSRSPTKRKPPKAQRTAMLFDSEASGKTAGSESKVITPTTCELNRQRTAMLRDIRVSRTAMLPYMSENSPNISPDVQPSPKGLQAKAQNLITRSMKAFW